MKKRIHRFLAAFLPAILLLTSCAPAAEETSDLDKAGIKEFAFEESQPPAMSELKIGVLYSGNEDLSGDTAALWLGTRECAETLGLAEGQIVEKAGVTAETSEAAAAELAGEGCRIVFSTDRSFEEGLLRAAEASPDTEFCQLGGEMAALDMLDNTHNYNVRLSESYFGAGTLAAVKTQGMRIGCISQNAVPEEIAEFTAFYLAAMTRNGAIAMDVACTGSDADADLQAAARYLASLGCDVITTTVDSDAAEIVCEELGIWYIGRNGAEEDTPGEDGLSEYISEEGSGDTDYASDYYPGTSSGHPRRLVCVEADWAAYMIKAAECITEGYPIPADWSGGLAENAVSLSAINPEASSEEAEALTAASLESVRTRERMIFAVDGFGVGGERLDSHIGADGVDYVDHGYFHDQDPEFGGSSSVFDIIVDGIAVHDLTA